MRRLMVPLALTLLFIGACFSGSDSDTGSGVSTGQLSASQAIQFYTEQVQLLQNSLMGSTTCDLFFQTLIALEGEIPCADGGSQQAQFFDSQCDPNSPIQAETSATLHYQDCRSPGVSVTGEISGGLFWNGDRLDSQLFTAGFLFNGLPQSFSNLQIQTSPQMPPHCEGQILIGAELCPVTPDCQFCPL